MTEHDQQQSQETLESQETLALVTRMTKSQETLALLNRMAKAQEALALLDRMTKAIGTTCTIGLAEWIKQVEAKVSADGARIGDLEAKTAKQEERMNEASRLVGRLQRENEVLRQRIDAMVKQEATA